MTGKVQPLAKIDVQFSNSGHLNARAVRLSVWLRLLKLGPRSSFTRTGPLPREVISGRCTLTNALDSIFTDGAKAFFFGQMRMPVVIG